MALFADAPGQSPMVVADAPGQSPMVGSHAEPRGVGEVSLVSWLKASVTVRSAVPF